MTEQRDDDWVQAEGAEDLPADVPNGEINEPAPAAPGPDVDETDLSLADPAEE